MHADIYLEMSAILRHILHEDAIKEWWSTPIPYFGGLTGYDLVGQNREDELLEYVKSYLDPTTFS